MELPMCRWRGSSAGEGRHQCHSDNFAPTPHVTEDAYCSECYCRDHKPPHGPPRWVSVKQLAADAVLLASKLPPDAAGVVGIPRSGMIPAAVIATTLHLPLYELADDGPRLLNQGNRGRYFGLADGHGPLVVVDDTVSRGGAVRGARKLMQGRKALFAAVYVLPASAGLLDFYHSLLPDPHLLEWNLFNSWMWNWPGGLPFYGAGVATDFDGVLCHDAGSGGKEGAPYMLPRASACKLIVTGRPERSRPQTEAWLRRWGVRWERLEMLPDGVPLAEETAAAHKAKHFAASACGVFVESEPGQAWKIHEITGKSVTCPKEGLVLPGSAIPDLIRDFAAAHPGITIIHGNAPGGPVHVAGPPPPAPRPAGEWPLAARMIARLKAAGDAGLGDTIARHLSRFGGDAFKRLFKKLTGADCGCGDRQAKLNAMFPYKAPS